MQDFTKWRLGVVGSGTMGAGIAHLAAISGLAVRLYDNRPGAAEAARAAIRSRLEGSVAKGRMNPVDCDAALARIVEIEDLGALAETDVVVEAIVEDLEAKQAVFASLETIVPESCILASNTSSIPIGAIARVLEGRSRVAGMHFFNPVPVMKLVEVIPGSETSPAVLDALVGLAKALGRTAVVVRDTPGFLVNFGGRAYTTEALAIVHEGAATPADVDAVMRDCCGFRMGPFELMDLTGMDVNFPVTSFIHQRFFADPRLRSTPQHRYMVETGRLGRKSGKGFFDYAAPIQEGQGQSDAPPSLVARRAFVANGDRGLAALVTACGIEVLEKDDGIAPILAALVGEDCSAYAARTGTDHRRLIGVDTAVDCSKRVTLMHAPGADPAVVAQATALFASARAVTSIGDSPGFVGQRILAMIANLGCEMAQIGLARPQDIDTAMKLGLNYPEGPLELTDRLGLGFIYQVMRQLQELTGDDRYRPSQWLRRRAALKLPAHTLP